MIAPQSIDLATLPSVKVSELGTRVFILNKLENDINKLDDKLGTSALIVKLHSQ